MYQVSLSENKLNVFNKVAHITIFFWIIKIISTTVGEASADFFGNHFGAVSGVVALVLLLGSVIIQLRFKKYVPWMYWSVIVLVAVFGTMFADGLHILGIPLIFTSSLFLLLLLATFWIWHQHEGTLDMHKIHSMRREIFYWIAIFFTFAFGTAAGDLFAGTFHLGFLDATLVFSAIIVIVPTILYLCKINNIALFWITYILTRPLGASGADLLGKPIAHGGFGLGDGTTALISLGIITALIVWLSITHKEEMLIEEQVDR